MIKTKAIWKKNNNKKGKLGRIYIPITLALTLLFSQIGACSSDKGDELYAQYNLFCDIVGEEFARFQKNDKSANAKFTLITAINAQVDKKITNKQVKETYTMLRNIGADDPYALLRHDVKSRTGKDFNCDAYKAFIQLNTESK